MHAMNLGVFNMFLLVWFTIICQVVCCYTTKSTVLNWQLRKLQRDRQELKHCVYRHLYLWHIVEADRADNDTRAKIHFERLLLLDVRKKLAKFTEAEYEAIFQIQGIPIAVHDIVKGILIIFEPDFAETVEIHVWASCVQVRCQCLLMWWFVITILLPRSHSQGATSLL